ncbi:MAG: DUF6518 family protein [Acidimicrobiales bacterium]|jgi:hypothetical protein
MRGKILLRWLLLLCGSCAFGVLDALVKGHHGGVRNAIGNVSAPWAIMPLLAAALVIPRRAVSGAVAGAVASVATLASFSLVRAGGLDMAGGGGLVVALGNRWFISGLVGGLVLGAGAGWLVARERWAPLIAITAALLMLEPAARLVWAATKKEPLGTYVPDPVVWALEIAGGCALAAFDLRFRRALHR